MEEFAIPINGAVRKKRTQTIRRSRPDSQPHSGSCDPSSLSPTPLSDEPSKVSSDENTSNTHSKRKEFSLNNCMSRAASAVLPEGENPHKRMKGDGEFNAFYSSEPGRGGLNNKRSSEGVLAPANWKNTSKMKEMTDVYGGKNIESTSIGLAGDGSGNDNKVKKVKLKVGGVTRTIDANSAHNGSSVGGSCTNNSQSPDAPTLKQKPKFQENSDDEPSPNKRSRLQGIPWKDFSRGGFSLAREDSGMGKTFGKNASGKQGDRSESVRKSRRVPKKRVLDGDFDDEEIDDEIRYLEKLKTFKVVGGYKENEEESNRKHRKLSAVSDLGNSGASKSAKDGKIKGKSDRASEDTDYEEEEEVKSDGEIEGKKKSRKESVDSPTDGKREMTLTTRQRALQSSKDASSAPGASLIEFPNGLPPAPPRKQKEKLTDVEQQLKKAEAAQRRRLQVEKAARESEAEAIRKILGQDSSRKKREDKIKKRQEELAQEKAANAKMLEGNTIRTVFGPSGVVMIFPNEMGLPSLFNSKPCSYPPPRENCAGPSCTNPYKYRDSKSKLPLCSLKCYKAVQENTQAQNTGKCFASNLSS